MVMALLIGILLVIRELSYDSEPLRRFVLAFSIVFGVPTALLGLGRLRRSQALRRDLESRALVLVSFGQASQAKGAPESLEYLPTSRRLWSVNGAPAPWRILNYFERY